jgi:hypothetical protein
MRSLFLRIFLWFWSTTILTGIALVFTFVLEHGKVPARWHSMLEEGARFSGTLAVQGSEQRAPAAAAYLEGWIRNSHERACLFDKEGHPITGEACTTLDDVASRVAASQHTEVSSRYGIAQVGMIERGSNGAQYVFDSKLLAQVADVGVNDAIERS